MEILTKDTGVIFNIKRFSVHDGPGIRTSIFLMGCPLNCIWCHNPEGIKPEITIWYNRNKCIACGLCIEACPTKALGFHSFENKYVEINRELCDLNGSCVKVCPSGAIDFTGKTVTISEIMDEVVKDLSFYRKSGGGVTITGGEPVFQPGFSLGILEACKTQNIGTAIETSLFCDIELIENIYDLVDLFIVDMKIFDEKLHEKYTGKPNYIIKENLKFLSAARKELIVRVPLVKGITDSPGNLKNINDFVKGLNDKIPVEHLEYNPLAKSKYQKLAMPYTFE